MARKTTLILLSVLVLCASVWATGAFGMSERQPFSVGERTKVELSGDWALYSFSPTANSAYAVYLFPNGDDPPQADALLYRGSDVIARGSGAMLLFEARLTAGEAYTLALSGQGGGVLEIMRATLGRSFGRPIAIDPQDGPFEKLLVRARDAHWYAFTARATGPATVYAEPSDDGSGRTPLLRGTVFTSDGRTICEAAPAEGGGFSIDCTLYEGAGYMLRVSADEDTTGAYALAVEQDPSRRAVPEQISLSADALSLEVGEIHALSATLAPMDAHPTVVFTSSDSAVLSVTASGELRALSAGSAVVTARGWGGIEATCAVSVARIPLSGVAFSQSSLSLRAGERVSAPLALYPADASDQRVQFSVEDASIAAVSPGGFVTGLSEGTTYLTAVARDGGHTDILEISVEPAAAKRRALLVGQQMYREDVNRVRVGSINTAQNMARMLEGQSVDGEHYETRVLLDSSRAETFAAIRETFRDATDGDVSLFYITCHGYYSGGMSFFELYDGSVISARDLERELRKIPGTVVVIADCCGSGGLIGKASDLSDFNRGIVRVFSGHVGAGQFASSKYKLIASASLDQDSYRISFDENATESDMATVLARALFDGAGWNLNRSRRSAARADMNFDRQITLNEIYQYASRRVSWYLNIAGDLAEARNPYVQNVQVYPAGDPFVLFGR